MPSTLPRFTYRTDKETLDKLRYIADNNFRTVNSEIDRLVHELITSYEQAHGEIKLPEEA